MGGAWTAGNASVHIVIGEDMHPYECSGSACRHCQREDSPRHDPGVCALCDPDYDHAPNPFWRRRRRRREKLEAEAAS